MIVYRLTDDEYQQLREFIDAIFNDLVPEINKALYHGEDPTKLVFTDKRFCLQDLSLWLVLTYLERLEKRMKERKGQYTYPFTIKTLRKLLGKEG